MKKYISIIALLSLFVIGCSEQSNINSPVNNVNANEPNWIALPKADGMQVNNSFSTTRLIDGSRGGTVSLSTYYKGGTFGKVTISSNIQFPKGVFEGKVLITMDVDDALTVTTFGPSMIFNADAIYNVTYTGLDLSNSNENVQFMYLAPDGTLQPVVHDGIVIDKRIGKLQVINAKIPHFSRYGFIN